MPRYNYDGSEKEESNMGGSSVAEIIAAKDREGGYPYPVYTGNYGNNGGLFGGGDGLLGGLVLGGLLGGGFGGFGGRGGCADAAVTTCQNSLTEVLSDFNATQHAQTLDAVNDSTATVVANANAHASAEAQRDLMGQLVNLGVSSAANFASLDKSLCSAFANTNTNINNVNTSVLMQGKDNIIEAMRTQNLISQDGALTRTQMAECCCELKMQAEANTNKILNQMCQDKIQDLRDELCEERRKHDQDNSNNTLINLGNILTTLTSSFSVSNGTPVVPQ